VKAITINNILRYAFGGFLLTGIGLIYHADALKRTIESAGSVVAPLVVVAVGAAWYCFHRYVLGEFVIYPLTHIVHDIVDRGFGRGSTNPVRLLKSLGVRLGERRSAYTDIRRNIDQIANRPLLERLDLLHAEYHVLAMTAEITLIGAIHGFTQPVPHTPVSLLAVSIVSAIAAVSMDIQMHRGEHRVLTRAVGTEQLKTFLRDHGYVDPEVGAVTSASINQSRP
jgi:hypothetical protein